MRKRKNIFASLDLGPEEIRLMIHQKSFKKIKILVNEVFPLKDIDLLNQRFKAYRPKEVIMLLPVERVLVRDVTLPPVDKGQIRSMLYFELSGRIPYSMEQIHLDYILLSRSKKEVKVKVFIIPALLQREVEHLKNQGIQIDRLIPRGLAVYEYLTNHEFGKRLIKFPTPQGELVLYPHIRNYFTRFYYPGQSVNLEELKELLGAEGIEPDRWDLLELNQTEADLLGAVHFRLRHPDFNLLTVKELKKSPNKTILGIGVIILAILLVNAGIFYLDYKMKCNELLVYQEKLEILIPRTEEIKELTAETMALAEEFESLQNVYLNHTDYLIWLKQLHFLLQEDTEVNILVLEDNILRELHGVSPHGTEVIKRLSDSKYFANPEFTAPITTKLVESEEVEEFNITAELVNPHRKGDETGE